MHDSDRQMECPDCRAALIPITMVARGEANRLTGAAIDAEVAYYVNEGASRSVTFAARMFEPAGTVRATLCSGCRRIFLHAVPS